MKKGSKTDYVPYLSSAMKSTFLLFWCLLVLVSGDSYEQLRSYVEPIEGDLPSPCNFGESADIDPNGFYNSPEFDNTDPFGPYNAPYPLPYAPQEGTNYIYSDEDSNFDYLDYEVACDLETCIFKCREFMKKDSAVGICQDNACYCKDHNEDIEENVEIDPISPQKIWSYDAQEEWQDVYPMCKGSPQRNGVRLLLQSSKHLTLTLDSLKSTEKSKNFSLSHIDLHWPYEEHSIDNIKSGMRTKATTKDLFLQSWPFHSFLSSITRKTDIDQALFKALTDLSPNDKVGVSVKSKSYLKFIQQKMNYNFGNYKGTLTQPPCSKDLLWFVNQPSTDDNYYISTNQLHILQNIRNIKGERIINNVRQVQK
ncbi:unnamed protein product [Lepeophtheirus salmonis]|uniref:carbonic anhydrase n=1 Tax=Lepeophtheirus salmonis TaxID=72036 RepID=A0A7R8H4M8_LEPSM|nr:unnamed protein product [Lepeophtheirus salmonis]CAF2863056.1 unnamed protein product [Lepeophtheirus salmonis]